MCLLVLVLLHPRSLEKIRMDYKCVHYGQPCFSFEGRVASLVVWPRGILLCGNTPVWILNPRRQVSGGFLG